HRLLLRCFPRADARLVVSSDLAHVRQHFEDHPGIVWPIDLVASSELKTVYDWGTSVVEQLVGHMPTNGIPTRRQLGRTLLDELMRQYGKSLVALLGAVNSLRPSRVIIIAPSRAFGRALRAELRLAAPHLHSFQLAPPPLPRVMRARRQAHTPRGSMPP